MPPKANADGRRKSGTKAASLIITLKASPERLRELLPSESTEAESPAKSSQEAKESPVDSPPAANGEDASQSNDATPAAEGTPADSSMGPPAKKKGVKRSAGEANGKSDGPKSRGRPGPKKKARLDDGTDPNATGKATGGHKLGPKANQGAINAGLRALDRSGKPCRKWGRGGFKLKSFTGVVWEVSRWTAPPKVDPESSAGDSAAASVENSSSKENKENIQEGNSASNSNSGVDAGVPSIPSIQASSPAPMAVTAAS